MRNKSLTFTKKNNLMEDEILNNQEEQIQNEREAIFSVVDLHAITVAQDPALLRERTLEISAFNK